jgi:spoIIIJ-associated protein
VEWVEVKGKSVDVAVEAAMRELGLDDRTRLVVEVIQEPEKGFLGMGGRDAIVRVRPKPARRRRRRGTGKGEGAQVQTPRQGRSGQDRGRRSSGGGDRRPQGGGPRRRPTDDERQHRPPRERRPPAAEADPNEQAPSVQAFLEGLVDSFGLDGEVQVRVDEDVIIAEVVGDQTEALVGTRGTVMEAIHELTRTKLQTRDRDAARVRLDIAGYAERRRQALTIYAEQLIGQIIEEGGEIMLEPMSAADRKVIHDAVAAHDEVESYSEGEAPTRYVVIAKAMAATPSDGISEEAIDQGPNEVGEGELAEEQLVEDAEQLEEELEPNNEPQLDEPVLIEAPDLEMKVSDEDSLED